MKQLTYKISEEQIETLSIEECRRLKAEINEELTRYNNFNFAAMVRAMHKLNERLFEENGHPVNILVEQRSNTEEQPVDQKT